MRRSALLAAAVALTLIFIPSAHARGRGGGGRGGRGSSSRGHAAAPASAGGRASLPGRYGPGYRPPGYGRIPGYPGRRSYGPGHSGPMGYYVEGVPGYFLYPTPVAVDALPPVIVPAPPVAPPVEPATPTRTVFADLRLDALGFRSGGSAGARLIVEGKHFGIDAGLSGLFAKTTMTDGTSAVEGTGLADVNLAYAPLSGARGRLRLEGGLGALLSPCMAAAGPDLGVAGEVRLLGPLGVEGALRAVPWPYRSLDWHAALQVGLGPIDVRGGVRQVWLDDAGQVDGVRHVQSFFGPWLGLGVRI